MQVRGSHVQEDYKVMPCTDDCQLEREMKTKFYQGKEEIKSSSGARETWPLTTQFSLVGVCDTF